MAYVVYGAPGSGSGIVEAACAEIGVPALGVWLDEAWRRAHLPKVDALVEAVGARPALAPGWAGHIR